MRCLGIDFGTKRIGLAVAETATGMIFPLTTLVRTTREQTFAQLAEILVAEKIEHIVVGLPTHTDGTETLVTRQARNFAQSLGRRTDLPIAMENEVLTSFVAEKKLRQAGIRKKNLGRHLDTAAAMEILASWLTRTGKK